MTTLNVKVDVSPGYQPSAVGVDFRISNITVFGNNVVLTWPSTVSSDAPSDQIMYSAAPDSSWSPHSRFWPLKRVCSGVMPSSILLVECQSPMET